VLGIPLGTEADVVCDSCNAMIAYDYDVEEGEESGEAYLYITRDAGGWDLRWATCEACGPITDECQAACLAADLMTIRSEQVGTTC